MLKHKTVGFINLGFFYSIYRVVVGISLFFVILFMSLSQQFSFDLNINYILLFLFCYLAITIFQFSIFSLIELKRGKQIAIFLITDIVFFSLLIFIIDYINIYIGLFFTFTIFLLNFIFSYKDALILTLTSVISTIYPSLILGWIDIKVKSTVYDSVVLSIAFILVFFISKNLSAHISKILDVSNKHQINVEKMQNINQLIISKLDYGYVVIDQNMEVLSINEYAKKQLNIDVSSKISDTSIYKDLLENINLSISKSDVDFFSESIMAHITIKYIKNISVDNSFILITLEGFERINERAHQLKLASIGQLSASIAHEIRNPLSIIVQAVDLMRSDSSNENNRYLDKINKQTERLSNLVESTLSMSKFSIFNQVKINIFDFFHDLIRDDMFNDSEFIDIDIDSNVNVLFSPDQLRQVFINLIKNAIRHNNYEISSKIIIRSGFLCNSVFIDVIDFGAGVSGSEVFNIFKPFYTTDINGTGLGLNLCKSICESNRSKIEYLREYEQTHFRVICDMC